MIDNINPGTYVTGNDKLKMVVWILQILKREVNKWKKLKNGIKNLHNMSLLFIRINWLLYNCERCKKDFESALKFYKVNRPLGNRKWYF